MKDAEEPNNRIGSKQWANDVLSFAIRTLEGKIEVSLLKTRISTVLFLRNMLLEEGFWWQAKIINFWVHRAMRGDFSQNAKHSDSLNKREERSTP